MSELGDSFYITGEKPEFDKDLRLYCVTAEYPIRGIGGYLSKTRYVPARSERDARARAIKFHHAVNVTKVKLKPGQNA